MNKWAKYRVFQGIFCLMLLQMAYISVKCGRLYIKKFKSLTRIREQLNEKNNIFTIVSAGRYKYC